MEELFLHKKELLQITDLHEGSFMRICRQLGEAEQVYKRYELLKKSVIAKIKKSIEIENPKCPLGKLETLAHASPEYEEFIEGYKTVCQEYFRIKYQKEAVQNRIEALRTAISLEKGLNNIR